MENCRFKTFNYKYNRYLPCELIYKLDNRIWKVREYLQKSDGSIEIIETATFVEYIENL